MKEKTYCKIIGNRSFFRHGNLWKLTCYLPVVNMGYLRLLGDLLEEEVGTDLEVICGDGLVTCHAVMLVAAGSWWPDLLQPCRSYTGTIFLLTRDWPDVSFSRIPDIRFLLCRMSGLPYYSCVFWTANAYLFLIFTECLDSAYY